MQGLLADRARRRALPAVVDSLRALDPVLDTARARSMVEAIGLVAIRNRNVDKALDRTLQREPLLAGAVTLARRRLSIGF